MESNQLAMRLLAVSERLLNMAEMQLAAEVTAVARALLAAQPAEKAVRYGCHCDLEPSLEPDGCVIDEGRPQDCVRSASGRVKHKEQCDEWRPITVVAQPAPMQESGLARSGEHS